MTETQTQEKLNTYQKYKEYRIRWREANKTKLNEKAKEYYINKMMKEPEFREVLNERTKQRNHMLKTTREPRPVGRPRKHPKPDENNEPDNTTPKPKGRPRKYI